MKKNKNNLSILKLVIALLIVGLMTTGGSYAYWVWSSDINKNVVFNTISGADKYIVYDEGNSYFVGDFKPTDTFCQNVSNTISFYKKEEVKDINFLATIYMDINSIGKNMSLSNDVYWIVTSGNNNISCEDGLDSTTVLSYGTFNGVMSGNTIKLVNNIDVLLDEQEFTIWMWIDNSSENLSNLSGETIDANIWTEFIMYDEGLPPYEYVVNFDMGGGVSSDDNLITTYTEPGEYVYMVSSNGEYQLEVWGAQGGVRSATHYGGYGGYSVGTVLLLEGEKLYANVGGQGVYNSSNTGAGGYNGGGLGSSSGGAGGGGGATHIATVSGELSTLENYKGYLYDDGSTYNSSEILIVAGGGGGWANYSCSTGIGGAGGGYTSQPSSLAATQTAGGPTSGQTGGRFGAGGYQSNTAHSTPGGGGGWYGGGTSSNICAGGGGSGYIGSSLLTDKYMYCYDCTTSDDVNTKTYSTMNVSADPISNYAKIGNGAVKIAKVKKQSDVIYGEVYGNLPEPTKEGYTFLGWYTEPNGQGIKIAENSIVNIKGNHTLYAYWIDKHNINYYANTDASYRDVKTVYNKGETLAILSGRTFYKGNNGDAFVVYAYGGASTGPFLVGTTESSIQYYTSYDSTKIHGAQGSLTFNETTYYYSIGGYWMTGNHSDTSGSGLKKFSYSTVEELYNTLPLKILENNLPFMSQEFNSNENFNLLKNSYTRDGYTFLGWSTSPTGEVVYVDEQEVINITDNKQIDLYAIWEKN